MHNNVETKQLNRNPTLSIIGFHGTSLEAAKEIEKMGFKRSYRPNHWLGQGVYFFADDFEEAKRWILNAEKREKGVVIKAFILVEEDKYLDLDTRTGTMYLKQKYNEYREAIREHQIGIDTNEDDYTLACATIDLCIPESIYVISKSFIPTDVKKENAGKGLAIYLELRHKQVCVRHNKCIEILEITEVCKNERFKRFSESLG